ncbi:uncharacterized protein EDB91DRAFT_1078121 [Suillus paluster]|uniref:uncharacterized protein n=1 Tax=Suillus paluster TaxID=48578 RepID=UPI001B882799|nr:uncharacterized protein EDB91DRAFT_1078121 [Suillus paluster]KAG1751308.1 hypothetical protein EDB91DRAFT_1078121 [Suillus paluster]
MQCAETAKLQTEMLPTPQCHGVFLSNKENSPLPCDPHPSDAWLRNPTWIDGGVNPPYFYHSHTEIEEVYYSTASGHLVSATMLIGGKAGALTIENDHNFDVAHTALLKKKDTCVVNVEFEIDTMNEFRIQKQALPQSEAITHQDEELPYGTKVPHIESFSEESQIHGTIIMQLKQKWSCKKHLSKHGEPGNCYATADATKHKPPNTVDFDVLHDGQLNAIKPHGHTAPKAILNATPVCSCHEASPPLSPIPTAGTEI